MIDFREFDAQLRAKSVPQSDMIEVEPHELAGLRMRLWQARELGQNSTSTDKDAA